MPKRQRKCPACSSRLIAWGRTAAGKKRLRCHTCGVSRTVSKRQPPDQRLFTLFRHYILWGDTYEQLTSLSGYSLGHLVRVFHRWLESDPPPLLLPTQSGMEVAFLLIDGLWFGRWFVLMVYRQAKNLTILHISVAGKEVATKVAKDLRHLLSLGYRFSGVVSDGGTGITKAIWEILRHLPHQVCLAHVHRQVTNALGRYPKDERVKRLKQLADHVWLIESKEALGWWREQLRQWVQENRSFLNEYRRDEEGHWWYIHRGVRKAVRILTSAPDFSFTFLDQPLMPKTTNELEAQFGHLGKRWLAHRGLKKERWEKFMRWFIYFYNQEKLTSRKQRKD